MVGNYGEFLFTRGNSESNFGLEQKKIVIGICTENATNKHHTQYTNNATES